MKLCLGTVQFGLDYGIMGNKKPSEQTSIEIINKCVKNNFDCIDTAAAYGNAEVIVGKFLSQSAIGVNVATKTAPNAFDGIVGREQCLVVARQQIKLSLGALQRDNISYYLLHNSQDIFRSDVVAAMDSIKQEGYTKKIGVSIYTTDEAMAAAQNPAIDCIQIPYNAIDRRLDKAGFFKVAASEGKKVFCRSVLLQGLLAMGKDNLPAKVSCAKKVLEKYAKLCNQAELNQVEFAIGYVAAKKGIDYIIIGVDNERQLEEQLRLSKVKLSQEWINEADKLFSEVGDYILNPSLWGK